MRDTLDILQEEEIQDCITIMDSYFKKDIRAMINYMQFPRKELMFHRGIFYNDTLIGYCIYGLEVTGVDMPEAIVFLLYIKPGYRQRGFGRMSIDALQEYQIPISVFVGDNEWFPRTDLAKEVKIF